MNDHSEAGFVFRDVRQEDKDEIMALTADTWEEGDYIHWVFDDWMNDPHGRFLVAVESSNGRIAGIDKMSFLAPTEAWFEGLRVHPDYRGHGLARHLERFMIAEASRFGAASIRLLTNVDNLPVHRNAYRHDFAQRFTVRPWRWTASGQQLPGHAGSLALRPATPQEAPTLFQWWRRTSSWQATDGLLNRNWSFSSTSSDEWVERAKKGDLLIPVASDVASLTLPPPMALISQDANEEGSLRWTISTVSATGAEWGELAVALVEFAASKGIREVFGLLPDGAFLQAAFTAAGFTPESDEHCLCMFERWLSDDRR